MAAPKSEATLLAEINTDITTAVNPESITPALLGDKLADLALSFFNKTDENLPALVIPVEYQAYIPTNTLFNLFQALLNLTALQMSGNTIAATQGRPGLFLANIGVNQQIIEAKPGVAPISHGNVLFTNDFELGSFDNGNNWSTFNYKCPAGGFNGKIIVNAMELETVVAPGFATQTFLLQMKKNGSAAGMPSVQFQFGNTFNPGDKFYTEQFSMDFSAAPLVQGDTISIEIIRNTGIVSVPTVGTFKINAGSISNED